MSRGSSERPKLTGREEFRFLTDLVLKHSGGDHTLVALHDQDAGTTRFANNIVVQNVNSRRVALTVTVAFGQRCGSAATTDLTAGAVHETVKRAEAIARACPEDPEYLPPVPPQAYAERPTALPETLAAGPEQRLALAREAVELCRDAALRAAGVVSSSAATVGVAADTGLFAHEGRADARFSVTATGENSTGWSSTVHRSIDRLGVGGRTRKAIEKAKRSAGAKEIPAGRYTVILEPPAVGGLLTWMMWMVDAKDYDKGTSPFCGKLGKQIVDARLTLANRPEHPDLLGCGFTSDGLPTNALAWIDRGVLRQLAYDRFTAKQHRVDPIPTLEAPCLSGDGETAASVDELVRMTERGILVTNFWYIRTVNPTDLTLTGMTRDGTFLVEDGQVTAAVHNFRFHESPLRALNNVEAFTQPMEASSAETSKLLVPAVKIREFNFSSVTRF